MNIDNSLLGYFKVTTCVPKIWVGDVRKNVEEHLKLLSRVPEDTRLIVFPELSLTGYTCGDLFLSDALLKTDLNEALQTFCDFTCRRRAAIVVGAPWKGHNCALVIHQGQIIGVVGKRNLPEYEEFYEHRWFTPDSSPLQVFEIDGVKVGIEICEDLWTPCPPSEELATKGGAEVIINLSASPRLAGKQKYLETLLTSTSGRLQAGYVYVSSGPWESSGDLVFSGFSGIYENGETLVKSDSPESLGEEGKILTADIDIHTLRAGRRKTKYFPASSIPTRSKIETGIVEKLFQGEGRTYDPYPFLKSENYQEVFKIQSLGLQRRLASIPGKLIIGVSGGTDSTLALLVAIDAIDSLRRSRKDILGVTMPCFGTTNRTKSNSWKLMEALGIDGREINITSSVTSHLQELGHPLDVYDIAYENAQARLRTQTLFDLSNMEGGIVLGTGDLSELALGWCTYGADHLSSYNPNVSVPKTLVRGMLHYFTAKGIFDSKTSDIIKDILGTPVSPELLPPSPNGEIAQVSEDTVGPYELHDYFLYHTLREGMSSSKIILTCSWAFKDKYTQEEIKKWYEVFRRRFRTQQFKRSCLPDGPKTGSISLSPRGDWRMPSDLFSLPGEV